MQTKFSWMTDKELIQKAAADQGKNQLVDELAKRLDRHTKDTARHNPNHFKKEHF